MITEHVITFKIQSCACLSMLCHGTYPVYFVLGHEPAGLEPTLAYLSIGTDVTDSLHL